MNERKELSFIQETGQFLDISTNFQMEYAVIISEDVKKQDKTNNIKYVV